MDLSASHGNFRVMTLNIAHARAKMRHQLLVRDEATRMHLTQVSNVIRREKPHLVALQEIDTDSFWNGRFDHCEYISEQARLPYSNSGLHQQGRRLNYGTALISRLPLLDSQSIQFSRPFGRPRKGFVLSTINWPTDESIKVDVVSLHLDFLNYRKRRKEALQLIELLQARARPLILMGDFNTHYEHRASLIPSLSHALKLHAWRPLETGYHTFPRSQRRLDWILASEDMGFSSYRVLEDPLSDHHAVIADIHLVQANQRLN